LKAFLPDIMVFLPTNNKKPPEMAFIVAQKVIFWEIFIKKLLFAKNKQDRADFP